MREAAYNLADLVNAHCRKAGNKELAQINSPIPLNILKHMKAYIDLPEGARIE